MAYPAAGVDSSFRYETPQASAAAAISAALPVRPMKPDW
jgi:hypothetical protein